MSAVVGFVIGFMTGAGIVICWALCAADQKSRSSTGKEDER